MNINPKEILDAIKTQGSSLEENAQAKQIINGNIIHVVNSSSGIPKLQSNVKDRFKLILSTPSLLTNQSPLSIRCCLCKRVISFPCWYYDVKYTVNHFHYFVCFNPESPERPVRCKKV